LLPAPNFASSCASGVFDVNLSGIRTGTDGALTLSGPNFTVPFPEAGSCIDQNGVSRATEIGAILGGGFGAFNLTMTPPPAVVGITTVTAPTVTPVYGTPPGSSVVGQEITMSATVSRVDADPMPTGFYGRI